MGLVGEPMTRPWDWLLVSSMGAGAGGAIGVVVGLVSSGRDDVVSLPYGMLGPVIGGVIGLGLGLCVGYWLWRTRPGRSQLPW